jgi:hypothetical protein
VAFLVPGFPGAIPAPHCRVPLGARVNGQAPCTWPARVAKDSSVLFSMRGWSFAASCSAVSGGGALASTQSASSGASGRARTLRSSGAWQAPREQYRPPPGPAFGGGGEEDVRTVGGHGDAVPELTANVVLRLVLADGLNHLLDLRGAAERDGHTPVTWHGADATASRIRAGRTGRRRLSRGTSPRPGSAASWRRPGTAVRHVPPGPGAPRA